MPRDGATSDDASVRITDLGAPSSVAAADTAPAPHPGARRRRALAVAGLLLLAGAAYTATAVPAPPSATTPVQPQAGAPLDVCSVNPDACPSPVPTDARVRFLPDGLTGTTGSVILCDPDTGACAHRHEGTFSACDVVESLHAGLGRFPQEVTSDLVLPAGQEPSVAVGLGGILSAVGIAYPDGTLSVCGPIEWPYVQEGRQMTQDVSADESVAYLTDGRTIAYRVAADGKLELVGVRSTDGRVTELD